MFAGLFAGALVISNWNPFAAASYSLDALATNMADYVVLLLFTLFMALASPLLETGRRYALAEAAKRRFKKRRSVCLGTWGLGMVCSVNDCLVAAVDGNVFRDICKDYRISSEKFSYVLDSTAAPAAAFFISDWIAYQISMIGQGLDMAGITGITPVSAYINGLPFNMYSIFTLIFVGMMMYTGRDYGPMLKAEVRALTTGQFTSPTCKTDVRRWKRAWRSEKDKTHDHVLRSSHRNCICHHHRRYPLHRYHQSGPFRHRHHGHS